MRGKVRLELKNAPLDLLTCLIHQGNFLFRNSKNHFFDDLSKSSLNISFS
jgi:hypothetical protein